MLKDLAIITLNYNSYENTKRQINNLRLDEIPNDIFYIIDNNSKDKILISDFCKKNSIKFIQNTINGGYAQGNNLAIKQAIKDNKKYILLLNPDIQINRKSIEELYNTLKENEKLAIIGPRLCHNYDKNIIFSDGGLLFPQKGFEGGHINSNKNINNVSIEKLNKNIDYVNGSALMFKTEILNDLGCMREDFFMYYEESEWCYRFKQQNKWQIAIKTDVIAYQEDSSRGEFYEFYMTRNRIWFCRLYNGNTKFVVKERLYLAQKLIFTKNKNLSLAKTLIKAVFYGLIKKL